MQVNKLSSVPRFNYTSFLFIRSLFEHLSAQTHTHIRMINQQQKLGSSHSKNERQLIFNVVQYKSTVIMEPMNDDESRKKKERKQRFQSNTDIVSDPHEYTASVCWCANTNSCAGRHGEKNAITRMY